MGHYDCSRAADDRRARSRCWSLLLVAAIGLPRIRSPRMPRPVDDQEKTDFYFAGDVTFDGRAARRT